MATILAAIDHNTTTNPGPIADDIVVQGNGDPTRGSVDGQSDVTLESTTGSITLDSKIDGQSKVRLKAVGDIRVKGKIDGQCDVRMQSMNGNIYIDDKIDGQCHVGLLAINHSITIPDVAGGDAHGRGPTRVIIACASSNISFEAPAIVENFSSLDDTYPF